jgi:hypothetical protein
MESAYFTVATELTIGYVDLLASSTLARIRTIGTGINGVILMGKVTSAAVIALQ